MQVFSHFGSKHGLSTCHFSSSLMPSCNMGVTTTGCIITNIIGACYNCMEVSATCGLVTFTLKCSCSQVHFVQMRVMAHSVPPKAFYSKPQQLSAQVPFCSILCWWSIYQSSRLKVKKMTLMKDSQKDSTCTPIVLGIAVVLAATSE